MSRLGLKASVAKERSSERFARRVVPSGRLVVREGILRGDRTPERRDRRLAVAGRLRDAGVDVVPDHAIPGTTRLYAADPFGNRLEFRQA